MNSYRIITLSKIEELQSIQKTHPPTSSAWMQASEMLVPLFAEMAKIDTTQEEP